MRVAENSSIHALCRTLLNFVEFEFELQFLRANLRWTCFVAGRGLFQLAIYMTLRSGATSNLLALRNSRGFSKDQSHPAIRK
jgi:hypothetical protein